MMVRREKGLCYNCEERVIVAKVNNTELLEDLSDKTSEVVISLSARSGNTSFQTLRIAGTVTQHQITMLTDSSTAKKLGCSLSQIPNH